MNHHDANFKLSHILRTLTSTLLKPRAYPDRGPPARSILARFVNSRMNIVKYSERKKRVVFVVIIFALELGWPDLLGVGLRWDCMDT